jgi:hypothetical protein
MNYFVRLIVCMGIFVLSSCAHNKGITTDQWIENGQALGTIRTIPGKNGCFIKEYRNLANLTERKESYGMDGQLEPGACTIEYQYKGNMVSRVAYFDLNHMPVDCMNGYAVAVYTYPDADSKRISFRDTDQKPTVRNDQVGTIIVRSRNKTTRTSFHKIDGSLIKCGSGYAVIERKYDDYGNLGEMTFFNEQDLPCLSPFKGAFVHKVKYQTISGVNNRQVVVEYGYDCAEKCVTTKFYPASSRANIESVCADANVNSLTSSYSESTNYYYNSRPAYKFPPTIVPKN